MNTIDYVIWGGLIIAAMAAWLWARSCQTRAHENLRAAAEHLGLELSAPSNRNSLSASGMVEGRSLRLSQYVARSGVGPVSDWFEIAVETAAPGLVVWIKQREIGWEVLGAPVSSNLTLGDAEFDQRWLIESSRPDLAVKWLTPELRALLDVATAACLWGEFRLENGWLTYREQSDLDGPAITTRIDGLAKMMRALATAAETVASAGR